NAELGRLLDERIEPRPLDRREGEAKTALGGLFAASFRYRNDRASLAERLDAAEKLAVAAVEEGDRSARRKAQQVAQRLGLGGGELDGKAGREIGGDVETGRGLGWSRGHAAPPAFPPLPLAGEGRGEGCSQPSRTGQFCARGGRPSPLPS